MKILGGGETFCEYSGTLIEVNNFCVPYDIVILRQLNTQFGRNIVYSFICKQSYEKYAFQKRELERKS